MKDNLSRQESAGLKGIAILIMMFHHCFCEAERYAGYDISFFPFSETFVNDVTLYFKVCVSIFAFITGYGLSLSYAACGKNMHETTKWLSKRIVKTFSGFWFVYILVFACTLFVHYPIRVYSGEGVLPAIAYCLVDFAGLANLFGTPTLNATWWYMSAAFVFIVSIPLLSFVAKRFGFIPLIATTIIIPRILGLGYLGGINAYSFILPVIFGMAFAKYELFSRIDSCLSRINECLVFIGMLGILVLSVAVWIKLDKAVFWEYHFALAPLVLIIFSRRYLLPIPLIGRFLGFLGHHSMNVFLIHTLIRAYFFADWTYSFGSMWLIALILLAESVVISITIELLKRAVRYEDLIALVIKRINDADL